MSSPQALEIELAAHAALYGSYVILFSFTVWCAFRPGSQATPCLKRITIMMFVLLTIHFVGNLLQFHRSRVIGPEEEHHWTIPLIIVKNVTTCLAVHIHVFFLFFGPFLMAIQGMFSDGLLACRFYVVYARRFWLLCLSFFAVGSIATVGLLSNMPYHALLNADADGSALLGSDFARVKVDQSKMFLRAWGWAMFGVNSLLTGAVLLRIGYGAFMAKGLDDVQVVTGPRQSYSLLIRAMVESALVTWMGLVLYEGASYSRDELFRSVVWTILPVFFGVSQCLITVRLGLARALERPSPPTVALTSPVEFAVRSECATTMSGHTGSEDTDSWGRSTMDEKAKDVELGPKVEQSLIMKNGKERVVWWCGPDS